MVPEWPLIGARRGAASRWRGNIKMTLTVTDDFEQLQHSAS